jgi:hypothetical protein
MISKTSAYAMAIAMITCETAFGMHLEAKPEREMTTLASRLAQASSQAFDNISTKTPEGVSPAPTPKPCPDPKPKPDDCDCCDGEPRVCLNLGNPWTDKCGTHTRTLGVLVDASTCNSSKEQHCHLPTSHIGCQDSCSCKSHGNYSDSDCSDDDSDDSDSDCSDSESSDEEGCERGRSKSCKKKKSKKCKKSKSKSNGKCKSKSKSPEKGKGGCKEGGPKLEAPFAENPLAVEGEEQQ